MKPYYVKPHQRVIHIPNQDTYSFSYWRGSGKQSALETQKVIMQELFDRRKTYAPKPLMKRLNTKRHYKNVNYSRTISNRKPLKIL